MAARLHRKRLKGTDFVAVTGSAGKTTTKNLITAVLGSQNMVEANTGTLNGRYAVCRTLLRTHKQRYCIQEIGTIQPGNISYLAQLFQPNIGVVTTVMRDHYAAFRSQEAVAKEKGALIEALPADGLAILNIDDPHVRNMASLTEASIVTYGFSDKADIRIDSVTSNWPDTLRCTLFFDGHRYEITTALHGAHLAYAVAAAFATGVSLGVAPARAVEALHDVDAENRRMRQEQNAFGNLVIDDSSKAPFDGLQTVITFLKDARATRKIAVLGTISDYPGSRTPKYVSTLRKLFEVADFVCVVNPFAHEVAKKLRPEERSRTHFSTSLKDTYDFLRTYQRQGDLILLKGSYRSDHLERLHLVAPHDQSCWRMNCGREIDCRTCPLLHAPKRRRAPGARNCILLIGGDTQWNHGDRAIRKALSSIIKQVSSSSMIYGISKRPRDDAEHFDMLTAASSMPRLLLSWRWLRSVDLILWGGGHLLQDDTSRLKNIYWDVVLNLLKLLSGRPILGMGVGLGPFNTTTGRYFGKHALETLELCITRDHRSATWVSKLGAPCHVSIASDPAVLLQAAPHQALEQYMRDMGQVLAPGTFTVGISVRRWFHIANNILPHKWKAVFRAPRARGDERFEMLLNNLVQALRAFADEMEQPVRYLFFPMYTAPWEADDVISDTVARRLNADTHVLRLDCDPAITKAIAAHCDLFVGMRLHSLLLAMGVGVPSVSISYSEKAYDVFQQLGLSELNMTAHELASVEGKDMLFSRLKRASDSSDSIRHVLQGAWRKMDRDGEIYKASLRAWLPTDDALMPNREHDDPTQRPTTEIVGARHEAASCQD